MSTYPPPTEAFVRARDFLFAHRSDYAAAYAGFEWPRLAQFNWALDVFDIEARGNVALALWVVNEDGSESRITYEQMRQRSNQAANFLRGCGVARGDVLLIMLPNVLPLWELMLGAIKIGAVLSPATTLLAAADLQDRITRGDMRLVIADVASTAKFSEVSGSYSRIVVGGSVAGWQRYEPAVATEFVPQGATEASDPLLLYFTSGTTAKPKMVQHTQQSYPVGHLSTLYWLGLKPGDVHLNISSPGWAKHAWSCFFAPWNAGATVFINNQPRFDARQTLSTLVRCGVTSLCAPPTVWRALILEDLASYPVRLRELIGAGEPLNPEVIERVRAAWGLTIRDGYGQTETTCMIGNPPGWPVREGSMGVPMPGYRMALVDENDVASNEGEIAVALRPAPAGVMAGYRGQPERNAALLGGAYFRSADVARRDAEGYYWYVGRSDDVFKCSDYRLSPFELESALLEHAAVAEAAVVPSPDAIRLNVPKAVVVLKPGMAADAHTAKALFDFIRTRLAPYQRIRRIEFAELPKTVSGKIRRVELRATAVERQQQGLRGPAEFWEEDFSA
ncbi:MAG: AMP-binding protein [Pseudomonadota bacterium]